MVKLNFNIPLNTNYILSFFFNVSLDTVISKTLQLLAKTHMLLISLISTRVYRLMTPLMQNMYAII